MSGQDRPLAPLPGRIVRDPALLAFADEVGTVDTGPVAVEGGRTQWAVGGLPAGDVRLVRAPTGIVAFEPAEMTVQVRAGTTLTELDAALAAAGQRVALQGLPPDATVGGVLAVGLSGPARLGHGPIRDTLLQARYVSAEGLLVTAGGPTVKNVTGFDLCRLLVGSLGTIGLLAEVTLRTRPRPELSCWLSGEEDLLHTHRMRALADAVLVGVNTVFFDNPQLTVRRCEGPHPVRVVIDPERRLDGSQRVFRDDIAQIGRAHV